MTKMLALAVLATFVALASGCATDAACGTAQVAAATILETQVLHRRTKCCLNGNDCYDPLIHGCCGGGLYLLSTQKCCPRGAAASFVVNIEDSCPCVAGQTGYCTSDAPECCTVTRFTDLIPTADQCRANGADPLCQGICYNPVKEGCCDTGSVFDRDTQHCCSITGAVAKAMPCPCETKADCYGAERTNVAGARANLQTNMECCQQVSPALPSVDAGACSAYDNYPMVGLPVGTPAAKGNNRNVAPTTTQCRGTCYDTSFQSCCNGAICMREYERCCNTTCCNTFTETCARGAHINRMTGLSNNWNYGAEFEHCTSIEKLDEVKSFWIYVLPTVLLLATFGALALALVFVSKAAQRVFSFVEKFIIFLGVLVVLFSAVLYFTPHFVYGVVAALAAIVAIIAAAVRVRWLNIVALVFIAFAVLLFLDPFHGNNFLNLSARRMDNNFAFSHGDGVFRALDSLFPDVPELLSNTNGGRTLCTEYYNYFAHDPVMRDTHRMSNPLIKTFGYCSRGWIVTALIFAAILFALLVGLFFLLLVGLALRFRKNRMEPIELEIVKEVAPIY